MKNQRSKIKDQRCTLRTRYLLFLICIFTFLSLIFNIPNAHAQLSSVGIATYVHINSDKVEDGDIVIATSRGYFLSSTPFDSQIAGVVSLTPAISIRTKDGKKGYPLVNNGTVHVKVNNESGNIKKGDFIATSSTPGTGMKVARNGYVLGQALDDASFKDKNDVKLLLVSLNLHFLQLGAAVSNSLLDVFNLSKIATYENPSRVLQYVVAGIITLASFGFGFLIFAKAVNTGLEALGRNPLAGRMIQIGILFNVLLIAVIIIAGIALAYLVIRL